MAELKPLKPLAPVGGNDPKTDFVKRAGQRSGQLPTPRLRAISLDEEEALPFKMMLYGTWGTGKTLSLVGLLLHGFKVLVLTTDVGGSGLLSVKTWLRRTGRAALLTNVYSLTLSSYSEVESFLEAPETYMPDIYDVDIDWLFWDGFSGYQQVHVGSFVGDLEPARSDSGKPVSEGRQAGLVFEQADWGAVRNATIRAVSDFCNLANKKTGKQWHKAVTCLESVKAKGGGQGGFVETRQPLLQGAGGILSGAAFDLIIETTATAASANAEEGSGGRQYWYVTKGNQQIAAKSRGIELEPRETADMFALWQKIAKQVGLPYREEPVPVA
ncbi:MAG: hypothetical protein ABFE02_17345 [Sulfuricella sp.]